MVSADWYHSFELPDGSRIEGHYSIDQLRRRYAQLPLPASLAGCRVLDIGAWDGWFAFEAERRGARVVATDRVPVSNFLAMHQRLASRVDYRVADLFDLPAAGLGTFDYVLLLNVLHHVHDPQRALGIVHGLTAHAAFVESLALDGPEPLIGLCRDAGFARVELLTVEEGHAAVACYPEERGSAG